MSKYRSNQQRRYITEVVSRSAFDDSPTLLINHYKVPKPYANAVTNVITAYKSGIPFNKAVDQAFTLDSKHLNRNKLAEHTLKTIANDY